MRGTLKQGYVVLLESSQFCLGHCTHCEGEFSLQCGSQHLRQKPEGELHTATQACLQRPLLTEATSQRIKQRHAGGNKIALRRFVNDTLTGCKKQLAQAGLDTDVEMALRPDLNQRVNNAKIMSK